MKKNDINLSLHNLFQDQVRNALADYMYAEGCSCCRHDEEHDEARAKLAKLLNVPEYDDGSGFNFSQFRTVKP